VYQPTGPPSGPAPFFWSCSDGQVVQSTEGECRARGGQAFRSEQEARQRCGGRGNCWVCMDGKVVQLSEGDVRARRTQCYGSEAEARRHCSPNSSKQTCWCCVSGQVVQTSEADCQEREGQCYGSRKEARKHCRGAEQTSTPTPTPHHRGAEQSSTPTPTPHHRASSTPHPTPKPTPHPTPRSATGSSGYPNNQSEPNPMLKKRYPPIKRGRPTPMPGQIIRVSVRVWQRSEISS